MLEMKVGDLVAMSARGLKLRGNQSLAGKSGVITSVVNPSGIYEYYFVYWAHGDKTMSSRSALKYKK